MVAKKRGLVELYRDVRILTVYEDSWLAERHKVSNPMELLTKLDELKKNREDFPSSEVHLDAYINALLNAYPALRAYIKELEGKVNKTDV